MLAAPATTTALHAKVLAAALAKLRATRTTIATHVRAVPAAHPLAGTAVAHPRCTTAIHTLAASAAADL